MKRDLSSQRFGRLVAKSETGERTRGGSFLWRCVCDCGAAVTVARNNLISGNTKSCGCLVLDVRRAVGSRPKTHGKSGTPTHRTWVAMRLRCRSPTVRSYENYGGRGIKVCDRWQKFENFLADMGERPGPDYSIDRIDPDGNYEPDNCRWLPKTKNLRRYS